MTEPAADDSFKVDFVSVAPFPTERFMLFLSKLKVQSKDFGLVPFRLLGSQRYILSEIERGLASGITSFVILKARQLGACLDPNTPVLKADYTWARIADLKVGDALVGVDEFPLKKGKGGARKMCTTLVEATGRVVEPSYEIVFDDGRTVRCTGRHRWLARNSQDGWSWRSIESGSKLLRLQVGHKVRWITSPWMDGEYEDGWFGGILDGEGSISNETRSGVSLCASQLPGPVWNRMVEYAKSRGYAYRVEGDATERKTKYGRSPVPKLVFNRMNELFRLIGKTRPARFLGRRFWEGRELPGKGSDAIGWSEIVKITPIGDREMVDIQTSDKTYVANGFVSHNSTFFLALDMFWAFEHRGLLGVFITHKEEMRDDFRSTVEVFFAETPAKYRINYVRHNRNLLILKNASKFRYLIAGTSEGRKGGLGRGGAANFVHATECAFYGNGSDLDEFRSQTSSLYPHRLQIYESTANGFNHFFDMWEGAKEDPTKTTIFVGWWRDERNQWPVKHPFFGHYMPDGAKTQLTPLERKRVREVRELYAYEISLQQIAWYRWHLSAEKDGDQAIMDQEFPWTEADAFQATGSKFFTVEAMTECLRVAKKIPFQTYRYKLGMKFEETEIRQVRDPRAELRIWEDASKFGYYSLGCDPAYGTSDEADRTVISIWRCYSDCMVQVAEYCSTSPSTYQCAWVLAHLAGYYGLTFLMPILEMNGPGQAVFDELEKVRKLSNEIRPHDESYNIRNILSNMRHYFYRRMDNPGGGEMLYQWKTTEDLKRRAMNQMKNGIELGRMIPRSVPLLEEMRRIVNDGGHIGAEGKSKDDRVMGAALAYQAWSTWVQPRTKNLRLSLDESRRIEENGGEPPTVRLIQNYLKRMNIETPVS